MNTTLKRRIEEAVGQRVVRVYEPSGQYSWLWLADGRQATYYPGTRRVVCDSPTPHAIDEAVRS